MKSYASTIDELKIKSKQELHVIFRKATEISIAINETQEKRNAAQITIRNVKKLL
ncbi:hypothetical protein ACO0LM_22280 [Undibacterium sp. Di26W]|uniref:hypothetical protein n=1 Tax=Undibacterium sp. Di26W TaxID=3413035 RepID=UPI003BEF97A0